MSANPHKCPLLAEAELPGESLQATIDTQDHLPKALVMALSFIHAVGQIWPVVHVCFRLAFAAKFEPVS